MKEEDYVITTNRARISMAKMILAGVLPGDSYGVDEETHIGIMSQLDTMERTLFAILDSMDDEDNQGA